MRLNADPGHREVAPRAHRDRRRLRGDCIGTVDLESALHDLAGRVVALGKDVLAIQHLADLPDHNKVALGVHGHVRSKRRVVLLPANQERIAQLGAGGVQSLAVDRSEHARKGQVAADLLGPDDDRSDGAGGQLRIEADAQRERVGQRRSSASYWR